MANRKEYNRKFFNTWTADMAYILGFMYADGNIMKSKRGNYYIAIYTADRDILVKMRKCLGSTHKLSKKQSETGCNYRIQIGSKEWFLELGKLGLSPNKTKRLVLPDVPKIFFGDFIRGYFDGDGNIWMGFINIKRKTPTRILQLSFTSGSHVFLASLLLALKEYGLNTGSIYRSKTKNFSRLKFSTIDSLKLSEIMYNGHPKLYLQRKKLRFDQFSSNRKTQLLRS